MSDERTSVDCEYCTHGSFEKNKIKVFCGIREKSYVYGCYIQCDEFDKDEEKYNAYIKGKEKREKARKRKVKKNGKTK